MDIYIERVEKSFKNRVLFTLKDIRFDTDKINVLVGRNGIGKTTLFNMIAGIDLDYKGTILYNGHKLNKKTSKEITLVSQKPYILKRSVYENLAYPLKLRKYNKKEIDILVEDYIEKFKLEKLKNQCGNSLSGGEVQRVSLARAMIFSPKVLLLDEYTASIDEKSIAMMEEIVLDYRREKKANVIMITHSKAQAKRLGDTIISMDGS